MIIGVPKEVKNNEYRVGLTPESSMALCKEGHEVLIQSNAGSSIGFSNQDYIDSGAKIINEAEEVFFDLSQKKQFQKSIGLTVLRTCMKINLIFRCESVMTRSHARSKF